MSTHLAIDVEPTHPLVPAAAASMVRAAGAAGRPARVRLAVADNAGHPPRPVTYVIVSFLGGMCRWEDGRPVGGALVGSHRELIKQTMTAIMKTLRAAGVK